MKFYITYFYNVRFLKPNQIAFSTAVWDPKWFHEFNKQDYTFIDKNGVWNGLRIEPLHPLEDNTYCIDCDHHLHGDCPFIKQYTDQLNNLNFDLIKNYLIQTASHLTDDPEIVILVHEKPDNPCSERWPLIKWFKDHGIDLIEFNKD